MTTTDTPLMVDELRAAVHQVKRTSWYAAALGRNDEAAKALWNTSVALDELDDEPETQALLRRLDAWTEGDNAAPLIRWAAARLRGEIVVWR